MILLLLTQKSSDLTIKLCGSATLREIVITENVIHLIDSISQSRRALIIYRNMILHIALCKTAVKFVIKLQNRACLMLFHK